MGGYEQEQQEDSGASDYDEDPDIDNVRCGVSLLEYLKDRRWQHSGQKPWLGAQLIPLEKKV